MSYLALQNNLLKKLNDCRASEEKKQILKNYFNKLNNFSYENYKYVLDKEDNLFNKKSRKSINDELKKELNLNRSKERCVFLKKLNKPYPYKMGSYIKKEEDEDIKNKEEDIKKEENEIKLISKNLELRKLKKDILVQKQECTNSKKKKDSDIEFWRIITFIIVFVILMLFIIYLYKLQE